MGRKPEVSMAKRVIRLLGADWSQDDTVLIGARLMRADGCALVFENIGYGLLKIALDLKVEVVITERADADVEHVARRIVNELLPHYAGLAEVLQEEDAEVTSWQEHYRALLTKWAPGCTIDFDVSTMTVYARWTDGADDSTANVEIRNNAMTLTFQLPAKYGAVLLPTWRSL